MLCEARAGRRPRVTGRSSASISVDRLRDLAEHFLQACLRCSEPLHRQLEVPRFGNRDPVRQRLSCPVRTLDPSRKGRIEAERVPERVTGIDVCRRPLALLGLVGEEDGGVDLYGLERSLIAAHKSEGEKVWRECLKTWKETCRKSAEAFKRYEEVRARGRKRSMVG